MLFYLEIASVLSNNTGQTVTRKRKGAFEGSEALWLARELRSHHRGGSRGSHCVARGRGEELEKGRGTRGRNEGKAKVRSPPRLEEAGVSAHAIGAAPLTEALLVFIFPTHALSRTATMKLAVHTVEMEARWQRSSRRRPCGREESENRRTSVAAEPGQEPPGLTDSQGLRVAGPTHRPDALN